MSSAQRIEWRCNGRLRSNILEGFIVFTGHWDQRDSYNQWRLSRTGEDKKDCGRQKAVEVIYIHYTAGGIKKCIRHPEFSNCVALAFPTCGQEWRGCAGLAKRVHLFPSPPYSTPQIWSSTRAVAISAPRTALSPAPASAPTPPLRGTRRHLRVPAVWAGPATRWWQYASASS